MTGMQQGAARIPLTALAAQATGQTHGFMIQDAGYESARASKRRKLTNKHVVQTLSRKLVHKNTRSACAVSRGARRR